MDFIPCDIDGEEIAEDFDISGHAFPVDVVAQRSGMAVVSSVSSYT